MSAVLIGETVNLINQIKSNQIKCWFLWRGENRSSRRKTSRSRVENQQTQPTYDAGSGNRTRDTLVEGERSHHCANPAPKWTQELLFYLDPGKKHGNRHHVVELGLPEAQRVEVCVLLVVRQQPLEQVVYRKSTIEVEGYRHIAQENDNDVEDIPETLEVLQLVFLNLQDLFDGVVDDEEDEDALAGHDEVVEGGDVTNQLDRAEGEGRDTTACGWVFKHQSGKTQQEQILEWTYLNAI